MIMLTFEGAVLEGVGLENKEDVTNNATVVGGSGGGDKGLMMAWGDDTTDVVLAAWFAS